MIQRKKETPNAQVLETEKHFLREMSKLTRQELNLVLTTVEYHSAKQPYCLP